jgi:Helix-turn-helix domain
MTDPSDEAANARAARARSGSPFLTPDQAAFYLGISSRTLQEYRTGGTGPRYRRHSRHLRYHIDDLDAWSQSLGEAGDNA